MRSAKPKLLPTVVCLVIVGLFAAVLPHPGLSGPMTVIGNSGSK